MVELNVPLDLANWFMLVNQTLPNNPMKFFFFVVIATVYNTHILTNNMWKRGLHEDVE